VRFALGAALVGAALAGCRPAPPSRTLLFLDRSPAAALNGLSWAPDPGSSRIVAFDGALHLVKAFTHARLATPVAVAPLGSRLLVSEQTGQGVVFDTGGRPVREWESSDPADLYAAAGTWVVSARSPYFVQFVAEAGTAPLLRILDTLGRPVVGIGAVHIPAVPFLAQLSNAGAVAIDAAGTIWFAPLARDEIVKLDQTGTRLWTTSRGLYPTETDPVLLPPRGGEVAARYAFVNVALALGPDGRLYALGGDDSAATRLRLDVIDTASGKILSTRHLGVHETAVALDPQGGIETLRADSLLALLPSGGRGPFGPSFALPTLHGDTIRLADYAGKVLLVNFWASWCHPCREEFPRMAALYGAFSRADFEIAAISDDLDRGKMVAFVDRFRPRFPILVGGGRMRAIYHYRGLPYSVLLDRRGRIVERIFGFGSAEEFESLRAAIAKEVLAP
jgi:thiol-disulfide isomerase/thioredoxin